MLSMCTGVACISKWMMDSGSQTSQHWRGTLQMWFWDQSPGYQHELMFQSKYAQIDAETMIGVCVYVSWYAYKYFLVQLVKTAWKQQHPSSNGHIKHPDLNSKIPFSSKWKHVSLEKQWSQELGKGGYTTRLEHLVVPENKEVLKTSKDGGILKGHRSQSKELPLTKAGI